MNSLKIPKTNLVFLLLLLFTLIYTLTSLVSGASQDKAFNQDFSLFQSAGSMLDQGNALQAEPILRQLLEKEPNSYILLWDYAISLAGQGKLTDAEYYFAKAEAERPFIVDYPTFLIQYGRVLYMEGKYQAAQKYLGRLSKVNADPNIMQAAQPLLADLKTKLQTK